MQMQWLKLNQASEQHAARTAQIGGELTDLTVLLEEEQRQLAALTATLTILAASLGESRQQAEEAKLTAVTQDTILREQREGARKAQHARQEAQFMVRSCTDKIADLGAALLQMAASKVLSEHRLAELLGELASEAMDDAPLQAALEGRAALEAELNSARSRLERAASEQDNAEQGRLTCELSLNKLREQLGALALQEQEARLYVEQWAELLQGVEEAPLLPLLVKPGQLNNELNRLIREIDALGAVNLAALDELKAAVERKSYLDAQCLDLQAALATLDEAIKHIDAESRTLLMDTYHRVNEQLAEIFPILFAGGEARLILSGEEILDSGVQVMAQPPGKKNSSIHLLSGGEKALTAIALIFSLFKLNPAPFCLLDEVDAPLDDTNTERLCTLIKKMAEHTQFVFISHNKIAMEMAQQLIGVTMQEQGVSRIVSVDIEEALKMSE